MLHDTRDDDILAVAQAIHVNLDGTRQIAVKQQGVLGQNGVDLTGLVVGIFEADVWWNQLSQRQLDVFLERFRRADDFHGAATQYVGWAHNDREANLVGDDAGLLDGIGDAVAWLHQIKLMQKLLETVAIFGEIDGIRRGAKDGNVGILKGLSQFERCLAAKLYDHADQFAGFPVPCAESR